MKRFLLATTALAAMTGASLAADLPYRRAAPAAPYVAVPVFTWTGFYVGANAGYGFSDSERNGGGFTNGSGLVAVGPTGVVTGVTPTAPGTTFGSFGNRDRDGFVGGGQIGYNYQIGQFVIGVEADAQYTDFNRGRSSGGNFGIAAANANIAAPFPGSPGNVAFNNNNGGSRSEFFGTVRGRLGYAFDRVLVYGTGGVAFRDNDRNNRNSVPFFSPTGGAFAFNNRRSEDTGYAVGGGVEYAFTPNITAKVEGLYVNFSEGRRNNGSNAFVGGDVVGVTNTGAAIVSANTFRGKREDDFAVVRAGVNYKFNMF